MTTRLSLITAGLALLFFGCAKYQAIKGSTSDLLDQAQTFFEKNVAVAGKATNTANYRANQFRTVQWGTATVQHYAGGDAVIAPISYRNNLFISHEAEPGRAYRLSDLSSLVINRDSAGHWQSTVVTFIPDSLNSQASPCGYLVWSAIIIYKQLRRPAVDHGKA